MGYKRQVRGPESSEIHLSTIVNPCIVLGGRLLYSYGLCNRIDIIYFDEIAKIESLIENVQNFDQHQV